MLGSHLYLYICSYTSHTYVYTYMHTSVYTHIHRYKHTYKHTHIHGYTEAVERIKRAKNVGLVIVGDEVWVLQCVAVRCNVSQCVVLRARRRWLC